MNQLKYKEEVLKLFKSSKQSFNQFEIMLENLRQVKAYHRREDGSVIDANGLLTSLQIKLIHAQ